MFDDGTVILGYHSNMHYMHQYLQFHVHILKRSFERWRIKLCPAKIKTVVFSSKCTPPPPVIVSGRLVFSFGVHYIDIYLDSKLTFKKSII